MVIEKVWQTYSTSSAETEKIGAKLGAQLRGGEVIELVSDLGGGKTTFVRGLAQGAGSTDIVNSPTFTISREYTAAHFTIAHFDFYRLAEAGIMHEELSEYISSPAYVTVIEWGDIVQQVLPNARVTIHIAQTADGSRDVRITYPDTFSYLFTDI